MNRVRLFTASAAILMFVAILLAMVGGDFLTEGRDLLASAWGRLTLIDLYVGLVFFSAFVLWRERSLPTALAWISSFLVLGNLATAVYLLWVLRRTESIDGVFARATDR